MVVGNLCCGSSRGSAGIGPALNSVSGLPKLGQRNTDCDCRNCNIIASGLASLHLAQM